MLNFKDLEQISTYKDELELHLREMEINFEAATNIQFTSGTTGFPKGATLSHQTFLNNALSIGQAMRMKSEDIICIPVPLYHFFGMVIGNLLAVTYELL